MKSKRILYNVLCLVLTFIMTVSIGAFLGCSGDKSGDTDGTLAFNDKLQVTYYVNELIDLTDAVDVPEGKRAVLKAEYKENGETKEYAKIALTFKPTVVGEVTLTITCDDQTITETIMVVDHSPTILSAEKLSVEKGTSVTIASLMTNVTVVPNGTQVKMLEYCYGAEEKTSLDGVEEVTLDRIGTYTFYYTATNSAGSVNGELEVTVTREMTTLEENDLTNTIKTLGISTIEQVDDHSVDSNWGWKVTAHKSGVFGTSQYWTSQASLLFDEPLDLSKYYLEMDVYASENTYEGGILINYATSRNAALYSDGLQMCPLTTYNMWTTISTASTAVKTNPNATRIKPVGIIISVLHKQIGEYNAEDVYMILDNLKICEYPILGENEVNDFTNKGGVGVSGTSFRQYNGDNAGNSDWSYKLSTKADRKAADYAIFDVYLDQEYLASEKEFSFFVKPNAYYELSNFTFGVLYDDNGELRLKEYRGINLEADSWNYISSANIKTSHTKFKAIRFYINTVTTTLKDAELLVDNLFVFDKSANEATDFSSNFNVNKYNDVTFVQNKTDVSTNSSWAWNVKGNHFDYFRINFDKTYAFGNQYFTMDIKNVSNFGGKILAQFVAEDGNVKQDWLFEDVATTGWATLSTISDASILLANYKAVNLYVWGEDADAPVEILIDNVTVKSKGRTEYFGVSADEWLFTDNGDDTTTVKLTSYTAGEKYVQLAKNGGYNNEFIDIDLTLNGTQNADLAIGMRIETPVAYSAVYGKQGFYIRFNNGFFTLYGPTFLGSHCGSYNYPSGMENCTTLRVGVINNNGYAQAYLYFLNAEGETIRMYTWRNMSTTSGPDSGTPIDVSQVKNGSFILYSLEDEEREFTVSDPFGFVPAPTCTQTENTITFDAQYADGFLVSIDGADEVFQTTNTVTVDTLGSHKVMVKAKVGEIVSEATVQEWIVSDLGVEVLNASGITYSESGTTGTITLTSPENAAYNKGSFVKIGSDYDDEFIKVGFVASTNALKTEYLGIGGRFVIDNTIRTYTNPQHGYYNVIPTPYGGGLTLNANGQTCYIEDGEKGAQKLINNSSSIALTAGQQYYFVYGLLDDTTGTSTNCDRDYRVYFALLDSNGDVIRAYHWSKSFVETVRSTYFAKIINATGGFVITSALANESRTLTYEIMDKNTGLGYFDNAIAPTLAQSESQVTFNAKWASNFEYQIDDGQWISTTNAYVDIPTETAACTVNVKASNAHVASQTATIGYLKTGEGVEFAAMSNLSSTKADLTSGNITYTTGGVYRNGTGQLLLKGDFDTEFIKIGFVAQYTNIYEQGFEIGLRESTASQKNIASKTTTKDPVSTYAFRIWNYNKSYLTCSYYTANFHHNTAAVCTEVYRSSSCPSSLTSVFTVGKQYYICAGIVTETVDDTTTNKAYYVIMDENSDIMLVKCYDLDYILNNNNLSGTHKPTSIPTSGWFSVYSYNASSSYTWEILEGSTILGQIPTTTE